MLARRTRWTPVLTGSRRLMAWMATKSDTPRPCQKEKNRIPLTQRNLAGGGRASIGTISVCMVSLSGISYALTKRPMDVEHIAASIRECSRRHLGRARAHLKGFRSVLTQTQNMAKQLRKKNTPPGTISVPAPLDRLSPGEVGNSLETQADTTIVHDADIGIPGIESKVSFSISVGDFEDDGGQDEDRFDLDVFCERGTIVISAEE